MTDNEFLPFKITEGTNTSTPFIAVSDTFPSDNFEVWTKENLEEMKKKNFEKSVVFWVQVPFSFRPSLWVLHAMGVDAAVVRRCGLCGCWFRRRIVPIHLIFKTVF